MPARAYDPSTIVESMDRESVSYMSTTDLDDFLDAVCWVQRPRRCARPARRASAVAK